MTVIESVAQTYFIATAILPLTIVILRRLEVLDRPNHRSSHKSPTPRGGGLALVVASLIVTAIGPPIAPSWKWSLAAGAGSFGILGFLDDVIGIPALRRLVLQVAPACLSVSLALQGLGLGWAWRTLVAAVCVIWVVGFVNVFNFMDGINGIAAAQVMVAGGCWTVLASFDHIRALTFGAGVMVACAVAFLPFNFPRARVFLGDVGSYFLGAWLAILVVIGLRSNIPPEAMLAPLTPFLADTGVTLLRRIRRNEIWHEAHRDHIYQRLTGSGWSHAKTTGVLAAIMSTTAALGSLAMLGSTPVRVLADVVLGATLFVYISAMGRTGDVARKTEARRHSRELETRGRAKTQGRDWDRLAAGSQSSLGETQLFCREQLTTGER